MEKDWYKSKTLQLSIAGVLAALAGYLSGELPPEAAMAAALYALSHGVNRFATKGPIKSAGGTSLPTPPPTSVE